MSFINSINTNLAAYSAQSNISTAAAAAAKSVGRLSSGNKIQSASDDVAALAIGTSLATNVRTLRTALTNASQASSLLQVADAALNQISDILQRQKAIAVQAGSGTLGATERSFLNAEFTALTDEIDRIAGNTNFNGVKLIDGALSTNANVTSNTTNADKSSMSINFTAIADADTLVLNGVTLTFNDAAPSAAGDIQRGGSISQSLDNLVSYLNNIQNDTSGAAVSAANKLLLSSATYSRSGDSLVITSRSGGDLSQFYNVDGLAANLGTAVGTVNGTGGERIAKSASIVIANIDTDISATSSATLKFAAGVLTVDGTTVATIANGDTLRGVMNKINANTGTTGINAFITGTANAYILNIRSQDPAAALVVAGAGLGTIVAPVPQTANTLQSLGGGSTTGLGVGAVTGSGSTGGSFSILTDQTQLKASSTMSFPEIAAGDLTSSTNFGTARTITIEGQVFTFTQTAKTAKSATEITIGATLQETLDNAVEAINAFAANNSGAAQVNYAFNRIEATRVNNSIVISNRTTGNALDNTGGTLDIAASLMSGTSVSSANLSNASNNTGIDTKGVMNDAFIGTISGFSGTYVSANKADLSVTVGGITYTAKSVTTNPTSDTDVRFTSETGGYFDVKMRANQGVAVNNASDVATMAQKFDAAFAGVTFSQSRDVSSYTTSGDLLGSSMRYNTSDFSDIKMSNVTVTAPSGSNPNGSISFEINGETYTTLNPSGTQIGAYSVTRFVSASDANVYLEFKNGAKALSYATEADAKELENNLKTALGITEGSASLNFQVGTNTSDSLQVSISSAGTSDLFEGKTLNVLTQDSAAEAVAAIDTAIKNVTAVRASVGALQSRFNFASANIESSIQNQDAARGTLLDTDIALESTAYATSQVKLQAGISVLAQANQQLQSLLKLIG